MASLWAGPAKTEGARVQPGDKYYGDQSFTVSETRG